MILFEATKKGLITLKNYTMALFTIKPTSVELERARTVKPEQWQCFNLLASIL